mmetsp:Transcript_70889/g.224431  ORF Transcript_70889/g.224431 Transcript_70889/m.224431 type:complete len:462 (+) Transcript_70889:311-1696(+)
MSGRKGTRAGMGFNKARAPPNVSARGDFASSKRGLQKGASLEEDDVAIPDHVSLALLLVLAGRLDGVLVPQLLEHVVLHDLGADEAPLEVRVDGARRLGRLEPLADLPALDLVRPGREEVDQLDGGKSGLDDLWERAHKLVVLAVGGALVLRHVEELLLQGGGEGDHGGALVVLLDPLVDLHQELVLLARVVLLRQVHQVHHGLGGEQLQLVDHVHVGVLPARLSADVLAGLEVLDQLLAGGDLLLLLLGGGLALAALLGVLEVLTQLLQILAAQLVGDDVEVVHGVDAVLHVHHVDVLEGTAHVEDPVHALDVGEESVAQPLAVGRALDQAGDIPHVQEGRDLGLGLVGLAQPVKAVIWHVDAGLVGLDGAEREVLGRNGAAGEHVEHRRLAHVGEAHDTDLEMGAEAPEDGRLLDGGGLLGRHACFASRGQRGVGNGELQWEGMIFRVLLRPGSISHFR